MTFVDWKNVRKDEIGALGKGTLVTWPYIERSPGSFDWSNLDNWVETAQSSKIDFFYSFKGVPKWAASDATKCEKSPIKEVDRCHCMPKDIVFFRRFVEALVTRYVGRIQYYELWNEPEFDAGISAREMVTLTKVASSIIRALDPAAKIISPSLNGRAVKYADELLALSDPADFDIVSVHTYTPSGANYPETISTHYSGKNAILSPILPVLRIRGYISKPLWSTEGAWSDRRMLPEAEQPAFVARALLLHWSSGIDRFYWYAFDHTSLGRLLGTRAGKAYDTTREWMLGAVMTQACAELTGAPSIWSCELKRPGPFPAATVLWSVTGEVEIPVPARFTKVSFLNGLSAKVQGVMKVGTEPILLEVDERER
ncbi:cellulase family glycosylhydrolase [Bradyrhizobium lupini]